MNNLPNVYLINIARIVNTIKTEVKILTNEKYFNLPIAPGSLNIYRDGKIIFSFPLHKLSQKKSNHLIFETYDYDLPLPEINKIYNFQSWFTHKQIDLIKNKNYIWVKKSLPKDDSIEYCALSYENFTSDVKKAYTNGDSWISDNSYNTYIKNDLFRLRA